MNELLSYDILRKLQCLIFFDYFNNYIIDLKYYAFFGSNFLSFLMFDPRIYIQNENLDYLILTYYLW